MKKSMYIYCNKCNRKVRVSGFIWKSRLQDSKKHSEHKNCYAGWYCDNCTYEIENGIDY